MEMEAEEKIYHVWEILQMINHGRNENFREWIYFTDNYGIVRIY